MSLLSRRMMLELVGVSGMRYKTGEFVGDGGHAVKIEHNFGEIPFAFICILDELGEETSGVYAGIFLNIGVPTRYTSAVSKKWCDYGMRIYNDGTNIVGIQNITSVVYGVQSVDESVITINQYASSNPFISGKTYKWIAISDWRLTE